MHRPFQKDKCRVGINKGKSMYLDYCKKPTASGDTTGSDSSTGQASSKKGHMGKQIYDRISHLTPHHDKPREPTRPASPAPLAIEAAPPAEPVAAPAETPAPTGPAENPAALPEASEAPVAPAETPAAPEATAAPADTSAPATETPAAPAAAAPDGAAA